MKRCESISLRFSCCLEYDVARKKECAMLSKKVADLLNNQVNKELYSAYLYLDFENYYHDKSLEGFANWYHVQVQEEIAHAQLMMQYLQDNDYSVVLEAINKPNIPLNELSDPLKAGLKHEQYVTELIHTCYAAAYEEKDFRTMQFLDWFVKEQGEEEKNASDLISRFELFGHDAKGLYDLDAEYKTRTYIAPSILQTKN